MHLLWSWKNLRFHNLIDLSLVPEAQFGSGFFLFTEETSAVDKSVDSCFDYLALSEISDLYDI